MGLQGYLGRLRDSVIVMMTFGYIQVFHKSVRIGGCPNRIFTTGHNEAIVSEKVIFNNYYDYIPIGI